MQPQVLILDFGAQYTQLIARTVRELGVYCEIVPGTAKADAILGRNPSALIFSGGPGSVLSEAEALRTAPEIIPSGIPIFGICYGMQLLASELGGEVHGWARDAHVDSKRDGGGDGIREFGPAQIEISNPTGPFSIFKKGDAVSVWMSHGDKVAVNPPGFVTTAQSPGSPIAAFANDAKKIYGVQFHPEVHHTPRGKEILKSFLFDCAKLKADWNPTSFITQTVEQVKKTVPEGNVVCGLSGGVDSTVAAALVSEAIGKRLYCVFVDNGLLRLNEAQEVMDQFSELGLQITLVDAAEKFLKELAGVTDPEQKRKIIGRVFIEVFDEEAHRIKDVQYLVQGTLYPDVIESVSVTGKSAVIKSHHNVGGLIENMKLKLIEPLRELFKDEVRRVGRELGIADRFISRQPFPGPGLAVRCVGEITPERLKKLRIADRIVTDEIERAGLTNQLWQSFAVLLPVRSVGVMGDGRTFDETIAIRAVSSRDGMTADWAYLPEDVLRKISTRIVNETDGVNRVVMDISSKPPATIEWE